MLILASSSPRRAVLLRTIGVQFEIEAADIDETRGAEEPPEQYVRRMATAKAQVVATRRPDGLILAADTAVVLDRRILGKPAGVDEAAAMLRDLSGRVHRVLSAVTLMDSASQRQAADCEETEVEFAPLSEREIAWYVGSGEPLDKAGAYALQGRAALFVRSIRGSPSNVVGLPLACLYRLSQRLGVDWLAGKVGGTPARVDLG